MSDSFAKHVETTVIVTEHAESLLSRLIDEPAQAFDPVAAKLPTKLPLVLWLIKKKGLAYYQRISGQAAAPSTQEELDGHVSQLQEKCKAKP